MAICDPLKKQKGAFVCIMTEANMEKPRQHNPKVTSPTEMSSSERRNPRQRIRMKSKEGAQIC